ncbi:MAG: hypothetical protein ABIR37_03825, partial [Candidatus Saccharimonadales bacterium]
MEWCVMNALLFVLAVYGALNLVGMSDRKSYVRLVFIGLTLGVFFVNIEIVRKIGDGLRNLLNLLFVDVIHFPEFTSDAVLFVVIAALIALFWSRHQRAKQKGNNQWMWAVVASAIALMTISFVAKGTVWVAAHSSEALVWLQGLNLSS